MKRLLPWLLAALLALTVALQAATLKRQAAATADAEANLADLRAEVFALRDDLGDANDALDKQAQRSARIEGKAVQESAPVEPGGRPFDLHVATAAVTSTEPAR